MITQITLREAYADYLRYLEYRKRATKTTLITYKSILEQFLSVVGDIPSNELTVKEIDRFADIQSLRNLKPATYRNKLTIVRSFVCYLYKNDLSNIRGERIELPPNHQEEAVYLTKDESERILKAARHNLRDYAMLQVLLRSGVRVSELTSLKTTDIFRRSISVKNGKGMKHRVTFINHEAEQAIRSYMKLVRGTQDGLLFPNPDGNSLSRVIVGRKVTRYAEKAGIDKHVTVHTLRHTFATGYLDAGGRIEDLQQMLGHADLKTTMLYLHFTNVRLQGAYDKIMH